MGRRHNHGKAAVKGAANFLTALTATFVFKLALFHYATSGAEGATSGLLTWPRLVLCLGWDVVSAAVIAAVATGLIWAPAILALYGVFLVVSYHIATIVGTPL